MKGEWDNSLKWPIRYKRYKVLINHKHDYVENGEIVEKDLKKFLKHLSKPSTERSESLGIKFISHFHLLQEKYSKDDSL